MGPTWVINIFGTERCLDVLFDPVPQIRNNYFTLRLNIAQVTTNQVNKFIIYWAKIPHNDLKNQNICISIFFINYKSNFEGATHS